MKTLWKVEMPNGSFRYAALQNDGEFDRLDAPTLERLTAVVFEPGEQRSWLQGATCLGRVYWDTNAYGPNKPAEKPCPGDGNSL